MKYFDYILKFGFALALALVTVFVVSPLLYNKAVEQDQEVLEVKVLEELKLSFLNAHASNYLKIEWTFNDDEVFKNIFYTKEKEHRELLKFLYAKNILKSTKLVDDLPVSVSKDQVKEFTHVEVEVLDNQSLKKVKIGNQFLLGKKESKLKDGALFLLCGFVFLLGVSTLVVSMLMLIHNLKIAVKTGKLPELLNTVESKLKGLTFLYRLFNKK